jgi:hypothetical protein
VLRVAADDLCRGSIRRTDDPRTLGNEVRFIADELSVQSEGRAERSLDLRG